MHVYARVNNLCYPHQPSTDMLLATDPYADDTSINSLGGSAPRVESSLDPDRAGAGSFEQLQRSPYRVQPVSDSVSPQPASVGGGAKATTSTPARSASPRSHHHSTSPYRTSAYYTSPHSARRSLGADGRGHPDIQSLSLSPSCVQ